MIACLLCVAWAESWVLRKIRVILFFISMIGHKVEFIPRIVTRTKLNSMFDKLLQSKNESFSSRTSSMASPHVMCSLSTQTSSVNWPNWTTVLQSRKSSKTLLCMQQWHRSLRRTHLLWGSGEDLRWACKGAPQAGPRRSGQSSERRGEIEEKSKKEEEKKEWQVKAEQKREEAKEQKEKERSVLGLDWMGVKSELWRVRDNSFVCKVCEIYWLCPACVYYVMWCLFSNVFPNNNRHQQRK